ncbi:MAG: branched-chain amino acid ABC transporter permease [Syntrophobacteraceae bacterium]
MTNVQRYILSAVLTILWFALPPAFLNAYWIDVLNSIGIYALLALSLNIIVGDAGLFNLGHAAFYAVGAYTAAILNTQFHIPIFWLIPVSAISAGIFALIIARPIIHLRGDYLCIVTIGIGEIVRIALINNLFGLTGGANGIFGISRPSLFGFTLRTPYHFFYYIWIVTAVCAMLFYLLKQSRFGRALDYLREDEIAAQGCGINTPYFKLAAFVLGAAFAGVAGNIYASKMTIISPESFTFWESVLMFAIVILGGSGSVPGMFIGALLVIGLPELFRDFADARMLIFGAAMILMMLFRTQGLLPQKPRKYRISPAPGQEAEAA